MKKSVYIETSIPSYLTARPSRDIRVLAWQQITDQWWEESRNKYDLFISQLVTIEAGAGNPEAAARRLDAIKNIPELTVDDEMENFAQKLINEKVVPPSAKADALHISTSIVHSVDYLLTWNCRHINNVDVKLSIRKICESVGYSYTEICSPIELL